MPASSRSHARPSPQYQKCRLDGDRKPVGRMPTKLAVVPHLKNEAAQHVTKSSKSAGRTVGRPEMPENDTTADSKTRSGAVLFRTDTKSSEGYRAQHHQPAGSVPQSTTRHALQPPPVTRAPSLASNSSISSFDGPKSLGGLRRKPSVINRYAAERKSATEPSGIGSATMPSQADNLLPSADTACDIICDPTRSQTPHDHHQIAVVPEQWIGAEAHVSTVPGYAQSATPSTRYTASPFSQVPTPSSASSCSPSVIAYTTEDHEKKPTGPNRSRRPAPGSTLTQIGLPPLRESSTSSSNSTVKPGVLKARPQRRDPTAQPNSKGYAATTTASRTRQQSRPSSRASTNTTQIPPELAHLNVDVPAQESAALLKPLPPHRPSRDNTPSITDMKKPASVVQSDLPRLYTTFHKRRPSIEAPMSSSAPSPGLRTRFGLSSRSSSRQESPRVDSAVSSSPSTSASLWGQSADATKVPTLERRRLQRKGSPAVASAPMPSKSPRFGLFSRKPKNESVQLAEKPRKQPAKGPAAGTGHEGYGRFGVRGRSSSLASSRDLRSSSIDSKASYARSNDSASRNGSAGGNHHDVELDSFLRNLQAPKVLRGSGLTSSSTVSTPSTHEAAVREPSSSSSVDSYPRPQLLPSAMQGGVASPPRERPVLTTRLPSDSSEDDWSARFASRAAAARTSHHSSLADRNAAAPRPQPSDTMTVQPEQIVHDGTIKAANVQHAATVLPVAESGFEGREGLWLRPQHPPKTKSTSKWSFLQRAHASPRSKGKNKPPLTSNPGPHADDHRQRRDALQFGMLDPIDPIDLYEVQQLVQESEISQDESVSDRAYATKLVPYDRRHSNLLPAPPRHGTGHMFEIEVGPIAPRTMVRHDQSGSPALLPNQTTTSRHSPHVLSVERPPAVVSLTGGNPLQKTCETAGLQLHVQSQIRGSGLEIPEKAPESSLPRYPRLSPIGRIPRIVSKRDREYKLPDTSFSRPRTQNNTNVRPPGTLYSQIRSSRELTSPIESGSHPASSSSTKSERLSLGAHASAVMGLTRQSTDRTTAVDRAEPQTVPFAPRKNSGTSDSSGSGTTRWNAATVDSQKPQQDDLWAEYDDLMDDMLPQQTPLSAGSSLGAPFQYADVSCDNSPSFPMPLNFIQPPTMQLPSPPRSRTTPAVLSVPQQVARFMQPSLSPLMPCNPALSGILDHYGNESTVSLVSTKHDSLPQTAWSGAVQPLSDNGTDTRTSISSRYSRTSGHSRSASLPEAITPEPQARLAPNRRHKDTQLLGVAEDSDESRRARNTLRHGALMTSKWLSFGQVLFSPARNEMDLSDDPRVLVIDGLGSDWSYYVALNYPRAQVYDLSTAATPGAPSWPGISKAPPPNLRHIPLANIAAEFPFPKGFFTAVVLRFPVATTDHAYHACIHECKRVLRPGGHLEVAVLDLDLVNMGPRARSLIKGLKIRMQRHDPSVSLRNMSDFMVRLIGQKGYVEIKRGVVGVPTVGHVPKSQDLSSVSSKRSAQQPGRPSLARVNTEDITFADVLDDARNSRYISDGANDERITRMVAKVGRWWYSTCYETSLLGDDKSIWQEPGLLRECEKQGTSFRLLLLHAQKPQQTRRRTVSV